MRRKLTFFTCGLVAALGASAASASVDDAQTAIKIARQLCAHVGGLQPVHGFHWQVRLDGGVWKVSTVERGDSDMIMLIPRHGPVPSRCNSHIAD